MFHKQVYGITSAFFTDAAGVNHSVSRRQGVGGVNTEGEECQEAGRHGDTYKCIVPPPPPAPLLQVCVMLRRKGTDMGDIFGVWYSIIFLSIHCRFSFLFF
jgi:hypothetical protein